ncbi:hypothetical protein EVAR_40880_1 [Eumeta japonica]|uniref:Uncharacterized protein n=1 Tax=Eumeta variegata TaxID=151549 RepID=A0A4C1X4D6_EUMVA|nr:hypothetical protein EVAR_40880_1 [Eumeta japonica]
MHTDCVMRSPCALVTWCGSVQKCSKTMLIVIGARCRQRTAGAGQHVCVLVIGRDDAPSCERAQIELQPKGAFTPYSAGHVIEII